MTVNSGQRTADGERALPRARTPSPRPSPARGEGVFFVLDRSRIVSFISSIAFFTHRPPSAVRSIHRSKLIGDVLEHSIRRRDRLRVHLIGALRLDHVHELFDDIDVRRFEDRKSTRLNSSHVKISYAVFCLKKK